MKKRVSNLFLVILPLILSAFSGIKNNEAKADSINHQVIDEPAPGLNIEETTSDASMTFLNPSIDTLPHNKYLGITINAVSNVSTHLVDPYIYLQFSFMLDDADQYLYFDMTNPDVISRITKNSLYYETSEIGYTCPNRYYAESSCYFFLIKEGFIGTIYIQLSDYFSSDISFNKLKIFSDGKNHWNIYQLHEVFYILRKHPYRLTQVFHQGS